MILESFAQRRCLRLGGLTLTIPVISTPTRRIRSAAIGAKHVRRPGSGIAALPSPRRIGSDNAAR